MRSVMAFLSVVFGIASWSGCEVTPVTVTEVLIDLEPFQEGCQDDGDCVVVTRNACDYCSTQRDAVISRSAGDAYVEAITEAADDCSQAQEEGLCGSSRAQVEAQCSDGVCESRQL